MQRPTLLFLLTWLCAPTTLVRAESPPSPSAYPAAISSLDQLVRMQRCELEALYANAQPGPIPHGYTPGRVISKPGHPLTMARARLVNATVWQGKVFHEDHIINKTFGREAVTARLYQGASWYDGKPSIIIDYEGTSALFGSYRDEFREVAPGIYLGLTYKRQSCGPDLRVFFALDGRCTCR